MGLGARLQLSDPELGLLWVASAWYRFDVVVSAFLDAAPLAIALEKSVRLGQRVSIVVQPIASMSMDSLGSSALFMS